MADFSIYPTAIDGYAQLPLVIDNVTKVDAVTINRLRSAIINIENELGADPSGINYTTVKDRINALEFEIETITREALAYKNPVRVATTSNISNFAVGAPSIVDGVTLQVDDRILVYNQDDASENGIYSVEVLGTGSDGTWIRAEDANDEVLLLPGTEVLVMEGDTNSLTKFWLVTPGPYNIGVTDLEFVGGLHIMQSDSTPTTILASTAIGSSFAAGTATDSISVRNFKKIDFSFLVSNLGSIDEIRARVLYSLKASPAAYSSTPSDWNIMLAKDIISGVPALEVDPYTLGLAVAGYPRFDSLPVSFGFQAPVSGLKMMVIIWAGEGDPTGSVFTGSTLRRI